MDRLLDLGEMSSKSCDRSTLVRHTDVKNRILRRKFYSNRRRDLVFGLPRSGRLSTGLWIWDHMRVNGSI
jgi:hypothetical protein